MQQSFMSKKKFLKSLAVCLTERIIKCLCAWSADVDTWYRAKDNAFVDARFVSHIFDGAKCEMFKKVI